ncbi:MAG: CocE/NonD family hydrolase [Alphaproteobacteria bacterium]|nr:CocE/NonD family hydrolase [Alphaproteobacteria bacterium]
MSDSAKNADAWVMTPDRYAADNPPRFGPRVVLSSCYVTMRDGVRIAVDVHLPDELPAGEALPVLLINTPYYRRFKVAPAEADGIEASPNTGYLRDYFVQRGYALVVADVRGTGASFGSRDGFRSPLEREDYRELADWVVSQPWCDGNIGSTGISYVGASADFLATTGHPAVKAVIPSFAVWDTYSDHFYLGGLLLNHLPHAYGAVADALDHDDREALKQFSYFADPRYDGPAPVDEDANGRLRDAAIGEHFANFNADDFLREFRFRDTGLSYDPSYNSAVIGPAHYAEHTNPDTAYYCVSGWMDGGGFGNAATRRYLSLGVKNKHLIMGPWDHGARTHISPFRGATQAPQFELMAEYLRFFDHYLKGDDTGLDQEQPIHYFTMGEEAWHSADQWPVPEAEASAFYFAADSALDTEPPTVSEASDAHRPDFRCGTGRMTRYERLSTVAVEAYYADWHGRDERMLAYTSAPLPQDQTLTGHPVITLHVASSEQDGSFFAYLEDVDPQGRTQYVTEGILRALHRKVSETPAGLQWVGPYHSLEEADAELLTPGVPAVLAFSLYPTSWLFRAGHRIRIAIAASDQDHFSHVPAGRIPDLTFHRSAGRASHIDLPLR